ncbi:MAG: hypothetical protein K2M95_02715 [Clostridiales bacterium]|nr:hypothetical protein [Clostridiales bacterium]
MIKEVPINDNWLFCNGFDKACLEKDYSWENSFITSLPHNIYECGEDYFDERNMQRVVTYSRVLTVPDSYLGKRLLLRFEGVLSYVEVYVNGIFVTSHKGETPFTADVTAPLLYNYENRIVLKVDSGIRKDVPCSGIRGPHCGFGGIHRDVVFLICDGRDIRDVCMRYNAADQTVTADVELFDWYPDTELDGEILCDGGKSLCSLALRSVQGSHVRLKGDASGAVLWSPDTPQMYTALIRLKQGGNVLDCKYVPFGFKTAVFLRDGFYLNGVRTKLIGLLRADSYPVIGRAATEQTERRDARLIKEAGCNAVRTMGLAGKDFIDECNKIGLMVIEDVYGDGYVGSGDWRDAFIAGVTDMVVRDRNAPSIIGWGVRVNNSRDCDELYFKANQAAKQADPTRNTIGARGFTGSHMFEDVFAYGSKSGPYSKANKLFMPHFIGEHSGGAVAKPYDTESIRVRQALAHLEVLDDVLGSSSAGAFGMSFCDFAAGGGQGSGDGLNH